MALPATKNEPTTLPELFDRMMEWPWRRPFFRPFSELWRPLEGEMPAVDMFKEDGNIVVKAAMAGAKPEEIEATVEEDTLTIRRQYKEEKEEKEKDYYYREQRAGSFVRQLQLPETVDKEHVEAELKDGMLTIKMAAAGPSPKEKRIPIKA